eukprot:EC689982.1.p1 GENE.EC689982.1~~EC689982.1.p1  ORF type:complete len:137 (+),score=20.60 EC689982.1:145-555(+)
MDPCRCLPSELWVKILSFLWVQDCLPGISASREWRDVVLSCSSNLRLRFPLCCQLPVVQGATPLRSLLRSLPRLTHTSFVRHRTSGSNCGEGSDDTSDSVTLESATSQLADTLPAAARLTSLDFSRTRPSESAPPG